MAGSDSKKAASADSNTSILRSNARDAKKRAFSLISTGANTPRGATAVGGGSVGAGRLLIARGNSGDSMGKMEDIPDDWNIESKERFMVDIDCTVLSALSMDRRTLSATSSASRIALYALSTPLWPGRITSRIDVDEGSVAYAVAESGAGGDTKESSWAEIVSSNDALLLLSVTSPRNASCLS